MRYLLFTSNYVVLLSMIFRAATFGSAQDSQNTEIMVFDRQYWNFSFHVAGTLGAYDVPSVVPEGSGFSIAQDFAPQFAVWSRTELSGSLG